MPINRENRGVTVYHMTCCYGLKVALATNTNGESDMLHVPYFAYHTIRSEKIDNFNRCKSKEHMLELPLVIAIYHMTCYYGLKVALTTNTSGESYMLHVP